MPSTTNRQPWSATWRVSSSSTIQYSGTNLVTSDALTVSVDNNKGGENPFNAVHKTLSGSVGSKRIDGSKTFAIPGPSSFGELNLQFLDGPAYSSADLWSRTNPSRPAVLYPVALFELRELPDMIRQAGRFLLHTKNWRSYIRKPSAGRDAATANLAFQFGWAPLIGDLTKMLTFQDQVEKRRREIDNLYSGRGLRRRIDLGSNGGSYGASGFISWGNYKNYATSWTVMQTAQSWAVLKWKPTSKSSLPPSDGQLAGHLTGIHPSHVLENIWEALPWSWLIDYFADIDKVLLAGNNYLATPAGGSVMTRSVSVATHKAEPNFGADQISGGSLHCVRHQRAPTAGISLIARVPQLGNGQLSILGSLSVLKARRAAR